MYNEILKIEQKLERYQYHARWFECIRLRLIEKHGIDLCGGKTDSNTVACKYVITYLLKKEGISNLFIRELLGYSVPSTVSTGSKRAEFFYYTKDTLFMGWFEIINNLSE